MTDKVKDLMTALNITEQEALQVIADDERIDKGEKLFEQTAEQKANTKKASAIGSRIATPTKRERKPNEDKRTVINLLNNALAEIVAPTITNAEQKIDFALNGYDYTVTLTRHNPKK